MRKSQSQSLEFSHESLRLNDFPGVEGIAGQRSTSPDGGKECDKGWSTTGHSPGERGCLGAALVRNKASIPLPGVRGTSVSILGLLEPARWRSWGLQPTPRGPLVDEDGEKSAAGEGKSVPEIWRDSTEEDEEMGELAGA